MVIIARTCPICRGKYGPQSAIDADIARGMSDTEVARKYKIGKTLDSGRHRVKEHRVRGHIQNAVVARVDEEEASKYRDIRDRAEEALEFILDTAKKARVAAIEKGEKIKDKNGDVVQIVGWEPRDFESAARCMSEYTRLLQILDAKEGKTDSAKSGLAEMREALKERRGPRIDGLETVNKG